MAKSNFHFVCQECGASYRKWTGKCEECGNWNTLIEEPIIAANSAFSTIQNKGKKIEFELLDAEVKDRPRIETKISELDRVLGGGIVKGSAILIGGDPGIGKSTLLLQMVAKLSENSIKCAYVSGEESVEQVRLRARRLNLHESPVKLLSATNINDILATIEVEKDLQLVVIDSIQTMFSNEISSAPGTVSQVRATAHELITVAKKSNIVMLIVGHVTKEGQIAGPKVLEHMVDTVLYFEGERGHQFRILRAVKNRFGGINEIGVFEMSDQGLSEVLNPSSLFLSDKNKKISGSAILAAIEGTRPVLVEVQGLIAHAPYPTPRRSVVGWDLNRLAMLIAVLGVRYGVTLMDKEVYLNFAGGLKISEPAADLAVACALISAITNTPLPQATIIFGEIGLSGEIRSVSHADIRIKEAIKLGFEKAIIPAGSKYSKSSEIIISEISHIRQLKDFFPNKT
ncbi:MAG: DNA repair protein RadA [Alphaproteobacteria bacterium]